MTNEKRYRISDHFSITWEPQGDIIVYRFTNPEIYCRLPESARLIFAIFSATEPIGICDALNKYRIYDADKNPRLHTGIAKAIIFKLIKMGALTSDDRQSKKYSKQMVEHYVHARIIPGEIVDMIISLGGIRKKSKVLDIGSGTGDLAIRIAEKSDSVTGIDISSTFLKVAARQAKLKAVHVDFSFGCGNKLVFHERKYKVITASQSFVWLDSYWAARGIYQALSPSGSFFAVESKPVLPQSHPFKKLLGFGRSNLQEVVQDCYRHARSYSQLFWNEKAQTPMQITGLWLFRQAHVYDMKFARAYFFSKQLASVFPYKRDPWVALQQGMNDTPRDQWNGEMYWLLVKMEKCPINDPRILKNYTLKSIFEL
jgi:ubiquinone/menaquinone biosynthesis C-methylase UbiE